MVHSNCFFVVLFGGCPLSIVVLFPRPSQNPSTKEYSILYSLTHIRDPHYKPRYVLQSRDAGRSEFYSGPVLGVPSLSSSHMCFFVALPLTPHYGVQGLGLGFRV